MLKIGIFLGAEPHAGGVFQYNQSLVQAAAELPQDEFTVVVAYTSQLWSGYLDGCRFEKLLVPRGIAGPLLSRAWRQFALPMGLWRKIARAADSLSRALVRQQCDLWVFPSEDAWGYQIPVPSLVSIHDLMHRYERRFPEVSGNGEFRRRERNYRNICAWAKGVLVDSGTGLQQLSESYPIARERIHTLPYIAPEYMFAPRPPEGFEQRYTLPAKFLFYPAQFWAHKNHEKLLQALGLLKSELPDLKLVLAGSKKNGYGAAQQLVAELKLSDDVLFLGYVPDADMPELYRRARALVMPTYFGPTNIPPLEAFVAGCPVAISGVYGMKEQCGDAALYFDPESLQEMSESIRRLWVDDRLCDALSRRGEARTAAWGQRQFNGRFREIVESCVKAAGARL